MRRAITGKANRFLRRAFYRPFSGWLGAWQFMRLVQWGRPEDMLAEIPATLAQLPMPTLVFQGSHDVLPAAFPERAASLSKDRRRSPHAFENCFEKTALGRAFPGKAANSEIGKLMHGEPQWINRKTRTDVCPSLQFRRPMHCFRICADDGRRICVYLSSELHSASSALVNS